jgi:hypothetical protein
MRIIAKGDPEVHHVDYNSGDEFFIIEFQDDNQVYISKDQLKSIGEQIKMYSGVL